MSTISKPFTFASGALIVASEHNSNLDTIYTDYNGGISNVNITAAAAITLTKLAALTASIVPVANASGFLTSSAVTATELGYVSGVTSAIQTQLTAKYTTGGALGTPSSGTLTNCTGLPVAGITASTVTALGVGSIELGNATDTTLSRSSGGILAVEGVTVPLNSTTNIHTCQQIELGAASDTTITRSGAGAIQVEGVQVILSGAALGTPSTGTLTNCTGLPAASVLAGTLGSGTFTSTRMNHPNNAIAASSNAATVPITSSLSTVTNNSAATLTITMTTTSAVDGQMTIVRILDSSAAAQTITWVNTENSTVTAPTTSNGSTTLFLTVGFIYNGGTSKWRCIASA